MWTPDIARDKSDLEKILALQAKNLKEFVSEEDRSRQGFLTLQHTLPILLAMHEMAPSIVIRDGERIVAYALTELPACRHLMPALEPMFEVLDHLSWKGIPITQQRFYTMGQVCVASEYRGQGVFDALYQKHREEYHDRFDLLITEISTANTRSIRAHERVGFQSIHIHTDHLDEWSMVLWDWN